MIKELLAGLLFCLLLARTSMAQVGIGTSSPDASAQLEIKSTSKGLLIPRVSTTGNVPAPAEGLLVYQTSAPAGFYVYKAGGWVRLITTADASGSSSSGTIIPYASGRPATFRAGTVSLVGFGNAVSNIYVPNGNIDLSGGGGSLLNFAFSMPRSGTITAISGYFNNVASVALTGTFTILVQLYQSTGSTNLFTPISGATLSLAPTLSGTVPDTFISSGLISGLSIPVTAGTRLLLVFILPSSNTVIGYVSAGVVIN